MTRPRYLNAAVAHLSAADPVLDQIMRRIGRCRLRGERDPFRALVGTVISQQISTLAASAIRARVEARFARTGLSPRAVLRAKEESLRACGLSGGKVRTLRSLSERIISGEIDLKRMPRQPEDVISAALLPTLGIGPWSVHMFLMFGLTRPDILPVGDYGLRVAVQKNYALKKLPDALTIECIAKPWRPYCTVASWYMWRSLTPVVNAS